MLIGSKEFNVGDHIRVVKAYSCAFYKGEIPKTIDKCRTGLTGVIVCKVEDTRITPYRVLVRIDDTDVRRTKYYHGETYVYPEDEVELIAQ